jgi:hypothetical protein
MAIAGVVMKQLEELGVRSFLLTSGTLSPMDSYAAELAIAMPIRVENAHVVKPAQVRIALNWVAVPQAPCHYFCDTASADSVVLTEPCSDL